MYDKPDDCPLRPNKQVASFWINTVVVDGIVNLIEGCHKFLKQHKENGLQRAISSAMYIANGLQIEPYSRSIKD